MKRGDCLIDSSFAGVEANVPHSKILTTIFSDRNSSAVYGHFRPAAIDSPLLVFCSGYPSLYKQYTRISTHEHSEVSFYLVPDKNSAVIST